MMAWNEKAARTCVASMADKDFFSSEQSHIMPAAGSVKITFTGKDGSVKVLKEGLELQAGEVIDATRMNADALKEFFARKIQDCDEKKLMMIHVRHYVKAFNSGAFSNHGFFFDELIINVNNGL